MALPVPTYRIGLAAQPLDDITSVVWTDITPYVLSRSSKAGAQHELSRTDAGTATYRLNNRDRRFDPTYTGGPYGANIRLGIPFQEQQTWAGTTYTVFTGYIDDWDVQWPGVADAETVISCVDQFKFLNLQQIESSRWKMEVRTDVSANIAAGRNTAWLRLDTASRSNVAADYSGQGWDGLYQGSPQLGLKSLIPGDTDTAMDCAHTADQRASLPYQNLISGFPFTVEFVFRAWAYRSEDRFIFSAYDAASLNASNRYLQCYIGDTNEIVAGCLYFAIANPYPTRSSIRSSATVDDGLTHHCVIVATSSTNMRMWIDGADVTVTVTPGTISYPPLLLTGYAIGNTPSAPNGDYGFHAGTGLDAYGNTITGGIQSLIVYDGLSLSSTRIGVHASAATFGWGVESSGNRFDHVCSAAGVPAANRGSEAGTTNVQMAMPSNTSLLAYLQLLADTEGGRLFVSSTGVLTFYGRQHQITATRSITSQATFTDDGTGIPYLLPMDPHLDDLDWWNRASVTRNNGAPQIADAIPGNNAPRTLTKSGLLMNSDLDARSMAQYLVTLYNTPVIRIRAISFEPADSPTLAWPAALGLGLGDRITVKRTPIGGGPQWVQDSFIEGITHEWSSGISKWRTTYALSPAGTKTYFKLDTSTLDGADVLFY